jgi:hypothetical protein
MFNLSQITSINSLKANFNVLKENHDYVSNIIDEQSKTVKNTAEQMVQGYRLYGLEKGLNTAAELADSHIPGITDYLTGLAPFDPNKLVKLPELGYSLEERINHVGHQVPLVTSTDALVQEASSSTTVVDSVLPYTPHPQHQYKDNSTRVLNRSGQEFPPSGAE